MFLVEIDSGAKPDKPGRATRLLSVLFDPLAAMNNAAFTNASRDKNQYYVGLRNRFSQGANLGDQIRRLTEHRSSLTAQEDEILQRLVRQQVNGLRRFSSVTFDANHFEGDNVITAWSLGPQDKARLLARFLIELARVRGELADLVKVARTPLGTDEQQLRETASAQVDEALKNRPEFLVGKSLKELGAELAGLGASSPEQLDRVEKQLADTRAGLKDVQDLPAAARGAIEGQIQDLMNNVKSAKSAVRAGRSLPPEVVSRFRLKPDAPLNVLNERLNSKEAAATKRSLDVLDRANLTQQTQLKHDRRANEGRRAFDKAPPKH